MLWVDPERHGHCSDHTVVDVDNADAFAADGLDVALTPSTVAGITVQ